MPTALFLSPHLDDAAFSCGGAVALLGDAGWRCVVATAFTASVPDPTGFALACQLDKGLGPEVDYMALRRDEDRDACALLGAEPCWLGLPEAPHRGYEAAPALFGPAHPADDVWRAVADKVAALLAELRPDRVYAPQGLGGHVDHRQVIRAVLDRAEPARLYASQIGFQFGGAEACGAAVRALAWREGGDAPAERFIRIGGQRAF